MPPVASVVHMTVPGAVGSRHTKSRVAAAAVGVADFWLGRLGLRIVGRGSVLRLGVRRTRGGWTALLLELLQPLMGMIGTLVLLLLLDLVVMRSTHRISTPKNLDLIRSVWLHPVLKGSATSDWMARRIPGGLCGNDLPKAILPFTNPNPFSSASPLFRYFCMQLMSRCILRTSRCR